MSTFYGNGIFLFTNPKFIQIAFRVIIVILSFEFCNFYECTFSNKHISYFNIDRIALQFYYVHLLVCGVVVVLGQT